MSVFSHGVPCTALSASSRRFPSSGRRVAAVASLGLSTCLVGLIGCSANKNYDERERAAARLVAPNVYADGTPCINTCLPDLGSRPLTASQCEAEEEGLEFFTLWDFESGAGASMYQYNDRTSTYRFPDVGWQPPAQSVERCGTDTFAFNLKAGPYRAWGGGLGRQAFGLRPTGATGCLGLETDPDICPDPGSEFQSEIIDVSEWEGISLWARRGPDSQPGLRVMLGDKYTDDDLSFLSYQTDPDPEAAAEAGFPRNCERIKECGCRDHKPCTEISVPSFGYTGQHCWDPDSDLPPILVDAELVEDAEGVQYFRCGASECDADYAAYSGHPSYSPADAQFAGKACTPYSFRTGLSGEYCFDPETDPEPTEANQRCGDHWLAPIRLSTDWQFHKVPFTELLQQGWAKEFPKLDLTAISLIRLTYDRGWVDVWIDDVKFYRRASD